MRMLAAALVVVLGGLICMTGCALTPLAGPPESTQSHRVRATPTGLTLDGKPWWPVGFNAYQLGTDWSVNTGCGAEVDLDDYFAQLPPRALTRFNLYSSFVVDKRSGLMDFGPLDRVFAAAPVIGSWCCRCSRADRETAGTAGSRTVASM
ncbi:hypothetical protein BPODLACK_00008 [Gordonia sp. YY1]|nr:hypothetical protein BPODLACK_00008 [Gordonia sp. YY1]